MHRDCFIIAVYCLICDYYQAVAAQSAMRRGDFALELTDEEVITIELCGAYFKIACDTDIVAYFRSHYQRFCPICASAPALYAKRRIYGRSQPSSNSGSCRSVVILATRCKRLIRCRWQCVGTRGAVAIAASSRWQIMVTVRRKTWTITASSWDCSLLARA